MKSSKLHWNRRREARHRCDYKSIVWARQGKMNSSRGWLNDQSWSGLSFVTLNRITPRTGEELEIAVGPYSDKTPCRVVRVEQTHNGRKLVGCEKDVPGGIFTQNRPKKRNIQNVRVPRDRSVNTHALAV